MDIFRDFTLINFPEQKNAVSMYRVNQYETDIRIGTDRDFKVFAKEGYSLNSLVYACLSKTANAAANVDFVHVDKDKQRVDGNVQKLLNNPNPYQTQTQMIQTIILHKKIAGISYWEVERSQAGNPLYLWPLRPDWVKKVVNQDGIQHYTYKREGDKTGRKIETRDVLEFKNLSPLDPLFSGQSSLEPISGIIDSDQAITDFLAMFFQKGANPTGYIKVNKPTLQPGEGEELQYRWQRLYGGFKNWFKPAIFTDDTDYKVIGSRLNELEFDKLDSRNESRICMALDVPPILVGAKVGLDRSTFSNYEEARRSWWEDTLIPLFDSISDDLNRIVLQLFKESGKIIVDTSRVVALKDDRDKSWSRAAGAYAAGLITKNQALQEMGLPVVDDGDVYYMVEQKAAPSKDEQEFTKRMDEYFASLARRIEENAN